MSKICESTELKSVLVDNGYDICPTCGREIDRGDIAWNNGSTEAGTGCCVIEIQCLGCDTEIAHLFSWYPEIETTEDLIEAIRTGKETRQE